VLNRSGGHSDTGNDSMPVRFGQAVRILGKTGIIRVFYLAPLELHSNKNLFLEDALSLAQQMRQINQIVTRAELAVGAQTRMAVLGKSACNKESRG